MEHIRARRKHLIEDEKFVEKLHGHFMLLELGGRGDESIVGHGGVFDGHNLRIRIRTGC